MNYQLLLKNIYNEVKTIENTGKVADYIPELAKVNPEKFGISLVDSMGNIFEVGDAQ